MRTHHQKKISQSPGKLNRKPPKSQRRKLELENFQILQRAFSFSIAIHVTPFHWQSDVLLTFC